VTGVKPFNYSRNVNLGVRAAESDVILMDDDAQLLTPHGFTLLSLHGRGRPNLGVCSAGIRGVVGNPKQRATQGNHFRLENRALTFVCVYLPRVIYGKLGLLDERFSGYGFGDNDYCARVLAASLQLGIWDGCVVDHSGDLPSTFRTRPNLWRLFEQNRQLFREKWGRDV
jgi:GT2 family glycosyltransferase